LWGKHRQQVLGRYSTFQYPDQDAYPEDFNADALFHVSVSVKRICLCLPYFKLCLHNIVIIHMKMQYLLSKMWRTVKKLSYIRVIMQGYDVLGSTMDLIYKEKIIAILLI